MPTTFSLKDQVVRHHHVTWRPPVAGNAFEVSLNIANKQASLVATMDFVTVCPFTVPSLPPTFEFHVEHLNITPLPIKPLAPRELISDAARR